MRQLWLRRAIMVLVLAGILGACGKKGDPDPPPGKPSTYPRDYPAR